MKIPKVTKKPKILYDVPFDVYLQIDAMHSSKLNLLRKSALHCFMHEQKEQSYYRLGHASHTAILQPDNFLREYALFDGVRNKRHKVYQEFLEANAGKEILSNSEYDHALRLRDAVRNNPSAGCLIVDGQPEVTILWIDERTGLKCKARIDYLRLERDWSDLKTSANVDEWKFFNSAADYGYHLQFGFYDMGLQAVGINLPCNCIAVEKPNPHDVMVAEVDRFVLNEGAMQASRAMDLFIECTRTSVWPGRYSGPVKYTIPEHKLEDADLEFGEAA